MIAAFSGALFRYADEGSFVSLRTFYDKRDGVFDIRGVPLTADADHLAKEATKAAARCANSIEPAVFCPPIATFSTAAKATEADLANGLALSVECDIAPNAARTRLEALLGPATVIVASGGEWIDPATGEVQPKLHLHWRLNEPTREPAEHGELKRARILATILAGGDASNKPIVHPIRWPGSWHCKGAPRLSKIETLTEHEISLSDALERLQEAVDAAGAIMPPPPSPALHASDGEAAETADLVAGILRGVDYHGPIAMLAMRLLKGGMSDAQAVLHLRGIMRAVPEAIRDQKDGATQAGRWQARYDDIPRAVSTARAKLGDVTEPSQPGGRQKLLLLTPAECAAEPRRDYVIKGLLTRGDHGQVVGLPGSGKSALVPYIGYRTSLGLDVFGHRTHAVPVLYLAAEDGGGMKMRVRALFERMGDAPNFFLQPVPIDLLTPASGDRGEISRIIAATQPGLVILDTVARGFPGLRENDPDQMAHVVTVAREFTEICNSAVLSLHHPPKEGMTPRGHSVLNGDLDVTLFLEGAGSSVRTVAMGKNRNGPSDATFSFSVASHCFGVDDDGDPITAPYVEPTDAQHPRRAQLTPTERKARGFLADVLVEQGKPLPAGPGFPHTLNGLAIHGVDEAAWREACESRRLSTAETPKDRGRAFRRIYGDLLTKGVVCAADGIVWLREPVEGGDGGQGIGPCPLPSPFRGDEGG